MKPTTALIHNMNDPEEALWLSYLWANEEL